jgi:hypothetical protein
VSGESCCNDYTRPRKGCGWMGMVKSGIRRDAVDTISTVSQIRKRPGRSLAYDYKMRMGRCTNNRRSQILIISAVTGPAL